MNIVILDPGYEHPHAHHQTVNLGIGAALAEQHGKTTVLAANTITAHALHQCAEAGLTVRPYFATPGYPPQADSLPQRQHEVLAQTFARELTDLYDAGILTGGEGLVLHTGYSFHLAGLAQALWRLRGEPRPARLLLSMMFHPGARLAGPEPGRLEVIDGREYLRHKLAFAVLHTAAGQSGIEVALAAPCRAYRRIYQSLWPAGTVQVHPAVGWRPLPTPPPARGGRPRVLMYLGGVKADKGVVFALQLAATAAQALPEAQFVFHFNDAFPGSGSFLPLLEALHQAGQTHDNVEVLTGNLDPDRYDAVLGSCQVACLLYDPAQYAFKTSGVFWDILRRPDMAWLATAGTWPADELAELGLPHATVPHGDVAQGVARLRRLLRGDGPGLVGTEAPAPVDHGYRELLCSSFGQWLARQFADPSFHRHAASLTRHNPDFRPGRGRILVVRTDYGHFGPISGPGGFIPPLRALGYTVDVVGVPLGQENMALVPDRLRDQFLARAHASLRSYQGNSVAVEADIQRQGHRYDIVHFLDAEHCGLVSALLQRHGPRLPGPRLVATFHQPAGILADLVGDGDFLRGFDRIHLMSPCQDAFARHHVEAGKLVVVPHGLAPQLLTQPLSPLVAGADAATAIPGFDQQVRGRRILLTVGNWLRDFDALLETAERLCARQDLLFVTVSKGLTLPRQTPANLLLLNQGISNAQLHGLYRRASLLFLPLTAGAANNAILEAMANGLPIVTTELPSSRYYTANLATFAPPQVEAYAAALVQALAALDTDAARQQVSQGLQARARELVWSNVAALLHENIYSPLHFGSKDAS
ncbi:glycosyltransferase [Solidesulfovibrio sp.]